MKMQEPLTMDEINSVKFELERKKIWWKIQESVSFGN